MSAHVEHILAKLGVARRAEIATWVATIGAATAAAPPSASAQPARPLRRRHVRLASSVVELKSELAGPRCRDRPCLGAAVRDRLVSRRCRHCRGR